MSKPETSFRLGVEKHLPPKDVLHREKMSNPYSAGTADSWYSGTRADLWVEWKFIVLPKRDSTIIDLASGKKPSLSHLQQHWLKGRHSEGRNVAVIVGCKEGGVVLRGGAWELPWETESFKAIIMPRQEIARFITEQCIGESQPSLHNGPRDDGGVPDHQHVDAAVRPRKARGAAKAGTTAR